MAYFGNSTDQAHSILAGYQRRSNQLQARSTSRYNVGVNLGSIKNRINDKYNKHLAPKYGNPQELQNKVQDWVQHQEKDVVAAVNRVKKASGKLAQAINDQNTVINAHKDIAADMASFAKGDDVDANKIAEKTKIIKVIDNTYSPANFKAVNTRLTQKVTDARVVKAAALEAHRKVYEVTDKVYLKDVEDFMVKGRLVRESKVALMFTPLTIALTLGAAGVLYYGFLQGGSTSRRVTGNKSAAMAVFG